jgi:hypothetical protein
VTSIFQWYFSGVDRPDASTPTIHNPGVQLREMEDAYTETGKTMRSRVINNIRDCMFAS